ncbi:PRC-barrel domain-containing protein [Cryptosporangium sp. NPDC048952]|uniref:PRC-barrel domain-containing protein n=1 Tax=Cryptosporangium sp. NPDC048952 TaxID=3363961 RepID=UPI0037168791
MLTQEHAQALVHAIAYDATGGKLGKIGQVYLDNRTQAPEWVTVHTGLFGTKESFVPVRDAELDGDRLLLPFEKHLVKNAPDLDPAGPFGALTPEQEMELYRHYGARPPAPPPVSAAIDEDTGRFSSFGGATALDGLADDTPYGEQAPVRPARPDLPADDPFGGDPYGPYDDDPDDAPRAFDEPSRPFDATPPAPSTPVAPSAPAAAPPPPPPADDRPPPEPRPTPEPRPMPTLSSFRPPTPAARPAPAPVPRPAPEPPRSDGASDEGPFPPGPISLDFRPTTLQVAPHAADAPSEPRRAPEPEEPESPAPNVFAPRSGESTPFPAVTTSPLVPLTPAAAADRGPADHVGRHRRRG